MSKAIAFIVPFKPRRNTNDWEADNVLLNRTLKSILNQTCNNFIVFVVYTDEPTDCIEDPKLVYVKSPFPFLDFESIPDNENELKRQGNRNLLERRMDKSKKIMFGCKLAREHGCHYLMSVDSDDLLSNRIVQHVSDFDGYPEVAGWYIEKGYVASEKSFFAVKNEKMNLFNGSTHILRSDLVEIPDFETARYIDLNMFTSHGWIVDRIRQVHRESLLPLGFYGVIYIVHDNNVSQIGTIYSSFNLRNIAKKIIRGKFLNKAIRKEFHFIIR